MACVMCNQNVCQGYFAFCVFTLKTDEIWKVQQFNAGIYVWIIKYDKVSIELFISDIWSRNIMDNLI